jgi:hypothetical protein
MRESLMTGSIFEIDIKSLSRYCFPHYSCRCVALKAHHDFL